MTTTKELDPTYNRDVKALARDINATLINEITLIDGIAKTTNGKVSTSLTINLVNPKNTPTDTALLDKLSQKIAVIVKQSLKDPKDYNTYNVRYTNKAMEGTVTNSTYTEYTYESNELNRHVFIVTLGERFDSLNFRATGKTTFNKEDKSIVTVISDYNFDPKGFVSFKIIKKTDSGELFITKREVGVMKNGANFLNINMDVAMFYNEKELSSGNYKFEFLINDSIVGSQPFKLE